MTQPVPLTQLKRGQHATLASTSLPEADAASLRALGLKPACELTLCRSGQPCIVSVVSGGCRCRIGLSRELADRVMVSAQS